MLKTIIAAAALVGAVTCQAAIGRSQFPGLADYCYPLNAPKSVPQPQYSPDGMFYYALNDDGTKILKYETATAREVETVMDVSRTRENTISRIEGFTPSQDGRRMMVYTDKQMIYRRSFTARYYIYDLHSRILSPLSEKMERQRSPLFSPNGRMAAFVGDDNNIYIRKIDYNSEVAVTTDGRVNAIINGVPDWVYEEEFSTSCSMTWSPDDLMLSYIKYDESQVPTYSFPVYEGTCEPKTEYALYPGQFTYKYPVAGEPNSRVSVHSYDVETKKTTSVSLPDGKIEYIPRLEYAYAPDRLAITTLDRAQTRMEIYAANPRSGVVRSLLVEQEKAWLEPATYEQLTFAPDHFVVLSSRSGWTHAYRYTYAGALQRQITKGDYDVTAYYGCDAKGNYYVQTTASGPINRVVQRVDPKGAVTTLSPKDGTAQAWFTPAMKYCVLQHSSSTQPPVYKLCDAQGKQIRLLEDNKEAAAKYADAPQREFVKIPVDGGIELNAFIVKPKGFDATKKYPVIMYQYSGPGSQEVLNRWRVEWYQYYATQGYVVVVADPRGTFGRGRAFQTIVYRDLGHYETLDQTAVARYMARQPYVDAGRIAITGWSFGGYETLMCATAANSPFAAAVAIAPVTDWRFYDTIYAERYMLTPRENADGYRTSAPLNRVDGLRCPTLIMHGTADDNVHLMNTIQFVSALETAGLTCDMLLFPNMNHSINYCDARVMVWVKALEFINQTFNKK